MIVVHAAVLRVEVAVAVTDVRAAKTQVISDRIPGPADVFDQI